LGQQTTWARAISYFTKTRQMKNFIRATFLILTLSVGLIAFTFIANDTPNINPIQEDQIQISSGYGMRTHPITHKEKMHTGIDFIAAKGTPVVATANGKILKIEFNPEGYGNKITIQHINNLRTIYAQLETVKVKEGQEVSQKDIIGTVGSSGKSTGPHLHYEIELNQKKVDPSLYINK
jgi:murein DD-endopeptidase MepM/ murein hydrolase activator NlpD